MLAAALIVAMVTALPLAATAAVYATARSRGETGTEPLRGPARLWAFAAESAATVAVLMTLPLRLRPVLPPTARGVVIVVPELHCSTASLRTLARRLGHAGWAVVAAAERPRARDAEALAAVIDEHIAHAPGRAEVVLLGHGFGGVLVTRYAATHPHRRVRHVVTLGTPHQGSRGLPYRLLGMPHRAPATRCVATDVIAIYSDFDAWLVPTDDAYCPGGFNIAVAGVGHCAMLWARKVADLVIENLAEVLPPAA